MYTVLILEDEKDIASAIAEQICASPYAESMSIEYVASPFELAEFVTSAGKPDILFADIKMGSGEVDGIQAVKALFPAGSHTQVIYITGYVEYCVPVYETDHIYLLLKPIRQLDINRALKRALEGLRTREEQILVIRHKNQTVLVPYSDILFIESNLRKVNIHTAEMCSEMYSSLAQIEDLLPPSFVRCHKSYLVNMDAINKVSFSDITLSSGETVPIGQRFSKSFKKSLASYFGVGKAGLK